MRELTAISCEKWPSAIRRRVGLTRAGRWAPYHQRAFLNRQERQGDLLSLSAVRGERVDRYGTPMCPIYAVTHVRTRSAPPSGRIFRKTCWRNSAVCGTDAKARLARKMTFADVYVPVCRER